MVLPISWNLASNQRLTVDLELSNACNFRCPICTHAYRDKPEQTLGQSFARMPTMMSLPLFERAIEECNRVASRVELGFFGEQTLPPRYLEFLAKLKQSSRCTPAPSPNGCRPKPDVAKICHRAIHVWTATIGAKTARCVAACARRAAKRPSTYKGPHSKGQGKWGTDTHSPRIDPSGFPGLAGQNFVF